MIAKEISLYDATIFLLPKHYSGRKPSISKAFGWYDGDELKAVCTFGKPASASLCKGVCGDEHRLSVYELNRLCRTEDLQQPLSQFVGWCLKQLKPLNWIIVSYSDTAMHHNGYIYQACNFIYTGATKPRTDMWTQNGKHSRHYKHSEQTGLRKVRSAKHRYVYFCTSDKKLKRTWMESLRYPVQPYPKGENKRYVLGEYLKDEIVQDERIVKMEEVKDIIEFDYSELRGRIRAVFGSEDKFADAMELSKVSLSAKLNNQVGFKQKEILKACDLLDILYEFIPVYFFTKKVSISKLEEGDY